MSDKSARLSLVFSCLGHAYMHMFTAFYFTIVLALEVDWKLPFHELVGLWTLGSFMVGAAALPAGWLADRWSAAGMMVVFFIGMGSASLVAGFLDTPNALMLALAAIGTFAAIYHPVGIPWVVRNAQARGKALGINGIFGSVGVAIAAVVAGGLSDLFGWRMVFILPGVLCLLTGVALLLYLKAGLVVDSKVDRVTEAPQSRRDMARAFVALLLTMVCMGLIFQATQAAFPKVFNMNLSGLLGDSFFGVGMVVGAIYTVGGVMQYLGGHFADKYPLKTVYVLSFLFQVFVLSMIAMLSGLPLIPLAMLSVALTTGALPAENLLLTRYAPQKHRNLAFGAKYVLAFGTAPLAIQLAALIQERTGEFVWLFLSLAALSLFATLAAMILPGAWRRTPAPVAAE